MVRAIAERGGRIPFAEYMELALYDPEHGYYSAPKPRYGRAGDFLTAPTASDWYPSVLGRLIGRLAIDGPMAVVDVAAGDGSLLAALLDHGPATAAGPAMGVERSATMRRRAAERLGDRATIAAVLDDLPRPDRPALIHASELYDAFPVDRVVRRGDHLMELWVEASEAGLRWVEVPARDEISDYFAGHEIELVDGQVAEANRGAEAFHRGLLEWSGNNAIVLVLDYGYEARRLYNPRGRAQGSLVCYRDHQLSRNPLEAPGQQDITAHVNWNDLRRPAADAGWCELGLWSLAEFLMRAGLGDVAETRGVGMEAEPTAEVMAARQEIKRLLDPEGMGSDLKVLAQGKGSIADTATRIV
jgi:SAM-dependent MidA family methyltransferase